MIGDDRAEQGLQEQGITVKTDIEIAQSVKLKPIQHLAAELGLTEDEIIPYGRHIAKVPLGLMDRLRDRPDGKLILVTASTPPAKGAGKTTTTIGLGQALARIGRKAIVCVREPSLGPCMGMKGGATGGGYAQVLPMEEINLHFTGDLHAVTMAHNLLAAVVDNHLHQQSELSLHPRRVVWKRVMDMNDRSLRHIILGLLDQGANGVMRESGFEITAASEVMAILCLSESLKDLKERLWSDYRRLRCLAAADHGPRLEDSRCHGGPVEERHQPESGPDDGGHARFRAWGALRQHRPRLQLPGRHTDGPEAR